MKCNTPMLEPSHRRAVQPFRSASVQQQQRIKIKTVCMAREKGVGSILRGGEHSTSTSCTWWRLRLCLAAPGSRTHKVLLTDTSTLACPGSYDHKAAGAGPCIPSGSNLPTGHRNHQPVGAGHGAGHCDKPLLHLRQGPEQEAADQPARAFLWVLVWSCVLLVLGRCQAVLAPVQCNDFSLGIPGLAWLGHP